MGSATWLTNDYVKHAPNQKQKGTNAEGGLYCPFILWLISTLLFVCCSACYRLVQGQEAQHSYLTLMALSYEDSFVFASFKKISAAVTAATNHEISFVVPKAQI